MESSFTPIQSKVRTDLRLDHSILDTPKPQASSTVNRKPYESLLPVLTKVNADPPVNSPSYLLNAIDGMKSLADQLGSLQPRSSDFNMPPFIGQQLRKAASTCELRDDRRGSVVADSEANSSLGILKLDELQGFSEAEDDPNTSDLLTNFCKEFSFQSFQKENVSPNPLPSKTSASLPISELETRKKGRQAGSDISSMVLNESSSSQSQSMHADLRLRLQKALAQRTIDRSMDSIRLSQLGDSFDVDAVSVSNFGDVEGYNENHSQDVVGTLFSSSGQTPSTASNATFGAANFLSFSGSPAAIDSISSENFQSADMAMDRLNQDEKSWRQHFEDLPAMSEVPKSDITESLDHLTQNLNLSTMSGIIAGEVTVSSSIMEDVGKRRLSAGEYFKLHTEQLGGESGDQRPNFGNSIQSPPKRRPHPPLINLNNSQGSVDEVPTRDAGFSRASGCSFAESLNFSASVSSDILQRPSDIHSVENPASRSIELMPPPPPRLKSLSGMAKSRTSEVRDSVSTRLSMSLSLPRESEEGVMKDLNSSSLSLDSGEKLVSISQMVRILQEQPSGPKSARQLVDEFMQKIKISQSKPEIDYHKFQSAHHESSNSSKSGSNTQSLTKTLVLDTSEHSPSRNQRVKEWISAINNSSADSVFDSNIEESDDQKPKGILKEDSKRVSSVSQASKASSNSSQSKNNEVKKNSYRRNELKNGEDEIVSEHDESESCFMLPPANSRNPAPSQLGHFSTPKVPVKQRSSKGISHDRAPGSQIPNKLNLSSQRLTRSEQDLSEEAMRRSRGSDQQSVKFQESEDQSLGSKHSSQNSLPTQKSYGRRSGSQRSEADSKAHIPDWKYSTEPRPPSHCGSARSMVSSTKSSSKHTDLASVTSGPLQIDSTHTQLSWASVSPASSVTQTFALRNKASVRVRLLVSSPNAAFKLVGERGEVLSELVLTLHSEETRRIHVVFSPISTGSVVGKLVISRVATSESSASSSEDRRLIALYGYGGVAELAVDGASKDRWAQLFLNMCMVDCDMRSEVSDVDASHDAPQVVATFSVRNSGKVPAFVSVQIAGELPFMDCGVYATPKEVSLAPGEASRITVRFDPGRDILQWLNKNADDMQLLANIWLSWSELATWQRIRRIFMKYYKAGKQGPLCTWGSLYNGDLGVGQDLKDNKSSESVLAQAVRRLKVAVLIERERLNLFDMDATLVFDQLTANETAMFNSPQLQDKTFDSSEYVDSPILAGMSNGGFSRRPDASSDVYCKESHGGSPLSSIAPFSKLSSKSLPEGNMQNNLLVITSSLSQETQTFSLEFPATTVRHKSKVKITFQNPSSEQSNVSISDLSSPFSVSTPKFYVPPSSYATMSIFFRPNESGTHHSTLNVTINGNHTRCYLLRGEGRHE